MSFNSAHSPREGGNVWSAGSRGGFARSNNDDNHVRGSGSFRGSYQNDHSRRGDGNSYGYRRQSNNDDEEIEILKDAIFIQNLPKNITRDDIHEAFSTVGPIKTDERSGGPKIWIYKDRMTGEGNGRATVTYEDVETASQAISEYNDQHISSINSVVRVQLAQRRIRNYDSNDRGGFNNHRGRRGGRGSWDSNTFHSSDDNHWNHNSRDGFRGRENSYRGGGATRGFGDSPNYSQY